MRCAKGFTTSLVAKKRAPEPPTGLIGPVMPPMIAWQRAGEPGFPFHWSGGPLQGTINYVVGEQLKLPLGESHAPRC